MTFKNEADLMKSLMATEAGRMFCGLIMRETGVFSPGARMTPEQTYLCEGERNVGLRVFNAILNAQGDPVKAIKDYAEWLALIDRQQEEKNRDNG